MGRISAAAKAVEAAPEGRQLEIFDKPGHLIRRLHQISTSVFIEEAKDYDLTPVQYASLLAVEFHPGIDQRRLGKAVALDRTTIGNVVQRLADKGLIERRQRNLRASALYVTGAARALIEVMRPRMEIVDDILLKPLTTGERATFMRLLAKLVDVNNGLSRAPFETI
jgi:MarR family transcriptional regulator, lower aerobic nicotinate degradation pathway regulator